MDKLILNAKPLLGFEKIIGLRKTGILFQWITGAPEYQRN